MATELERLLEVQSDDDWARTVSELEPAIHPVDRQATRIWFAFFPVKLHRALSGAEDIAAEAKRLILKGNYLLRDQVDQSAEFLYGHRYWPKVREVVAATAREAGVKGTVAVQIREAARKIATELKTDETQLVGITAVAYGTLQQVGLDLFAQPAGPGGPNGYGRNWRQTAEQVVAGRQRDDGRGIFGFLKSVNREFSVIFRELEPGCSFKVVNMQDVTMAAAADQRDWHTKDNRCRPNEGPIPVECRTAACGTCWVGVLSPTEKITEPNDREINKWKYFGYEGFTGDKNSPVRLACQLRARGNVTIVIPPWNGMIGKLDEK
ncbi:MAG: (2Fe-2S)-binding protein [Acidobacteria bacterium]|nr:(2Fe-2S)-binding protein [Acidobacteriota bacterium]